GPLRKRRPGQGRLSDGRAPASSPAIVVVVTTAAAPAAPTRSTAAAAAPAPAAAATPAPTSPAPAAEGATGTATAAAALPLPREVDDDGTAVEHGAVHRVNRCLCCLLRGIFDEAKASRLPAHTVDDHGRRHHVTEAGKCLAKLVIHGRKRQIPHVQSCVHYLQSSFAPDLAVRTKPGA